jgi:hypothetical protein
MAGGAGRRWPPIPGTIEDRSARAVSEKCAPQSAPCTSLDDDFTTRHPLTVFFRLLPSRSSTYAVSPPPRSSRLLTLAFRSLFRLLTLAFRSLFKAAHTCLSLALQGLSPAEVRKLRRRQERLCITCAAPLPAGTSHESCCRLCSSGRTCTCAADAAAATALSASSASSSSLDSSAAGGGGGTARPSLARTRSMRLADETGLDLAQARQLLSENDRAVGQRRATST